ncbi:hypothetical protein JTE90_010205 [Oedothorax gibbosus]|uniref:tRNA-dihydrouridine(16/17) synthase [NAD(P)(+)] n=1 Tax=Oedothorax gibbosus TaxID=931172 RepID=A0AAV6UKD3_9ARAC|nr:hypothetical protein JTE90_010205 [Oedothorax gibbosus]
MPAKESGYEFWKNCLGSPKYVAAPMVDMSELSFRMLCRKHGAQLCYSPMFHSQQFSQDFLYRQDNFSSCTEDRPLIVQFCANDPTNFVNAAKIVSSECDAVDLNLGCPQAIARKGYYGSFLQDDWDLIRSIVQTAAHELPVPVTCKMRILPGHYKKSIEYAKMLEDSGCSVLAVHGRTREQKGHATGLASWDVIREIKANVNIPVIANGNILSFEDVENCLKYTGADAVMSAEALLHNPALFSAQTPPVWKMVEEYLHLAEKYNTSVRCVRCHLFKLSYLCIYIDDEVQQILTEGSSFTDFYKVVELLKKFPAKYSHTDNFDEDTKNSEEVLEKFSSSLSSTFEEITDLLYPGTNTENSQLDKQITGDNIFSMQHSDMNSSQDIERSIIDNDSAAMDETKDLTISKNLPVWICHSRLRIVDDEKGRGCFSKYFIEKSEKSPDKESMSKKQLRRARHHERVVACMKEKRKLKKMRRKQKMAESQPQQTPICEQDKSEKKKSITKKEKKMLIRERLLEAQGTAPKVCINLGFTSLMESKELSRLSSQLRRLYGSNRQSSSPLDLYFCNLSPSDALYQICLEKNDGFSSYVVQMTPDSPEDLFDLEDIVYLSPDSENVLETLSSKKVYVIGGIVDGIPRKDLCLNHAKSFNIQSARLPISEYLVPYSNNPGTTVLTVNQVFDILLKYYEANDWTEALATHVPPRKGYCAPIKKEELKNENLDDPSPATDLCTETLTVT